MKKIKSFLFILLLPFFITGCVKFEVDLSINKDKSMSLSVIEALIYSEEDDNYLSSQEQEEFEERGFKVEDYYENGLKKGFIITKEFKNINDISSDKDVEYNLINFLTDDLNNAKLFKREKGFLKDTYIANFIYENNNLDENSIDFSNSADSQLNFNVRIPYKTKNNATDISENNHFLSWDLSKSDKIYFEFELYNATSLIFFYIFLCFTIIGIIFILIKLIKSKGSNNDSNLVAKQNYFKRTYLILLLAILIFTLIIEVIIYINYKYHYKEMPTISSHKESVLSLNDILKKNPNYNYYDYDNSYYFMYNNKVYYISNTIATEDGIPKGTLYSIDFNGENKKEIVTSPDIGFASFYFVYKNEAYYYTTTRVDNKKVNLSTGKITSLDNDDVLIARTLKNGVVDIFNNVMDGIDNHVSFKGLNLDTNKTIFEIRIPHSLDYDSYFFDFDNNNLFYIDVYESNYIPTLYKNNELIMTLDKKLTFLAVTDNYIYLYDDSCIYKININTKKIEKKFENSLSELERISSANNENYCYSDNNVYIFNTKTDSFDLLIENISIIPKDVYNINGKLYFTENVHNAQKYDGDDNTGSVLIYNNTNKKIENTYNGVRKISFDDNNLYIYIESENSIKTVNLNK